MIPHPNKPVSWRDRFPVGKRVRLIKHLAVVGVGTEGTVVVQAQHEKFPYSTAGFLYVDFSPTIKNYKTWCHPEALECIE